MNESQTDSPKMSSHRVRTANWSANGTTTLSTSANGTTTLPILTPTDVELPKRSSIFRAPKTVQEKVLCYTLCFIFIAMMVFLAALCIVAERWKAILSKFAYTYVNEDVVCNTEACKESAQKLLSNLDTSTDPCEDFYQYACGGWMDNNPIPQGKAAIMAYGVRLKEMTDTVVDLLEGIDPNVTKPASVLSMGRLYRGCRNKDARNRKAVEPLLQLLKDMGGWPMLEGADWDEKNYLWYEQAAVASRKLRVDIFSEISLLPSVRDNRFFKIFMQKPDFMFVGEYDAVVNAPNSTESQDLIDSIVDVARFLGSKLGSEELRIQAQKLVIFEYGLYLIGKRDNEYRRSTYEVFLDDLEANSTHSLVRYKDFTYKEYLNLHLQSDVKVKDETEIYLSGVYYFTGMPSYIDKVDPRNVANYIAYTIVETFSAYTMEEFYSYGKNGSTDWTGQSACRSITNTFMSYAVGRVYVDKYFPPLTRYHVNKMVDMIRLAYSSTLDQTTWMDKETMLYSLVKLQSMGGMVGNPEWIIEDKLLDKYYEKALDIEEEDYFRAIVKLCEVAGDARYSRWNKTHERNDTLTLKVTTVSVNAFYLPRSNNMVIPAGILGYPYYKFGRIDSINYGAIGTVIGHEISHAFDSNGKRFDHVGNLKNWWTRSAAEKFRSKTRCFAEQYENAVDDSDPIKVDGNKTLGENIADNGAIRNAFKAFRLQLALSHEDMTNRKVLPGLPATPEQLFFLGYASIWCSNATDDYSRRLAKSDVHSTSKLRVNIPLSNFKEFARAFECKPGTPMNPRHKCILW